MSRQFWIRGLVAALMLAPAACSSDSNPSPDGGPPPSASGCPAHTAAPGKTSDIAITDPDTCDQAFLGKIAEVAQGHLQRTYEIKVVLPRQNYDCIRGGKSAPVDGSTTPALGFCDGNKVFVVTGTGVTQRIYGTKIVYVWYVIANESAAIRFTEKPQQVCAAGYIVGKRPGADLTADLQPLQSVTLQGWPQPATKPWQYIAYGHQLARDGKGIDACAKPMPVLMPKTSSATGA